MKTSQWSAKCKLSCYEMFEVGCLVTLQDLGLQPWDDSSLGGFQYSHVMCMIRWGLSFKIQLAGLSTLSYW